MSTPTFEIPRPVTNPARLGPVAPGPAARLTAAALVLALAPAALSAAPPAREVGSCVSKRGPVETESPWALTVAAWNLLNLSKKKVGLTGNPNSPPNNLLLERYATILSRYDVVFLQEVLNGGEAVIDGIALRPEMANYDCTTLSQGTGRSGRPERYSVCYAALPGLTLDGVYDFSTASTASAANGTDQMPQQVWMRPPLRADFTYQPSADVNFQFSAYSIHTKPIYEAIGPPAGTPTPVLRNDSVHWELFALDNNTDLGSSAGSPYASKMVVGDLNADCTSYPATKAYNQNATGQDGDFPGWSWYVQRREKTNTAPRSHCAYDRAILNSSLDDYYCGHGIFTQGINDQVDGKQVSDHFLVWTRFGNDTTKKRQLTVGTQAQPVFKAAKTFDATSAGGGSVFVQGSGLDTARASGGSGSPSAYVYVTRHDATRYYDGNQTYPLTDVRGAPTEVSLDATGAFAAEDVEWDNPAGGLYTVVVDLDGDAMFDKGNGDFVNFASRADFIVLDEPDRFDDVVTYNDLGLTDGLYNEDEVQHVYLQAKGLTADTTVDVYIVSDLLLPSGVTSWQDAIAQDPQLDLATLSIPVNLRSGPIVAADLSIDDKVQTLTVDGNGRLFETIWPQPYVLFNMAASAQAPTAPTVFKPIWAKPGPAGKNDDSGTEGSSPCWDAWYQDDPDFADACNLGDQFVDYYGNAFNVVIDTNRDGALDGGDRIGTYDIDAIEAYFDNGNTSLDALSTDPDAIEEYQNLLSIRVELDAPLADTGIYDSATAAASQSFLCDPTLPASLLPTVVDDAQITFRVVDKDEYEKDLAFAEGNTTGKYGDLDLDDSTLAEDSNVCLLGEEMSIDGITLSDGSSLQVNASQGATVDGSVTSTGSADICVLANDNLRVALAETEIFLGFVGAPATGGASLILAVNGELTLLEQIALRALCSSS